MTLVSAIIPTYNRAHCIGEAVESVLRQTYRPLEVIVVDDGSTDETPAVLRGFGDRIHVVRQENAGPSAARNRGVARSSGSVLAFLDSDDLWLPRKIERQMDLLARCGDAVSCCLCNVTMHEPGRPDITSFRVAELAPSRADGIWLNPAEILIDRFVLFNQAAAIPRTAWAATGGLDDRKRTMEDYDIALKLSLLGPWAFIEEPLVLWRGGDPSSLSKQTTRYAAIDEAERTLLETAARLPADQVALRKRIDRRVREIAATKRGLELATDPRRGRAAVGRASLLLLRVIEAARRRLALAPRMRVAPLP
jgi:glycosyltransferase involved in cell wall biosynthesis